MLEIVPDIAQSTHGIRNIFADIRNVPTRPHTVLGMFLLAFSVTIPEADDENMSTRDALKAPDAEQFKEAICKEVTDLIDSIRPRPCAH